MLPAISELLKEITFKTSRSGGKGGQNVNKVATKVELIFSIENTQVFTGEEKERLLNKLESKLDSEGLLHIVCQEDRSQLANKEGAIEKLLKTLETALKVQKKRKPTRIPKAVVQKRLNDKSLLAQKKAGRKKPAED